MQKRSEYIRRLGIIIFFYSLSYFSIQRLSAAEPEPGLITKILDEYVSINLGNDEDISKGDTLWVFREKQNQSYYVGLVRAVATANEKCGARILFVRKGERIEVLDRVRRTPKEISIGQNQETDNLQFAQDFLKQSKKKQPDPLPLKSIEKSRKHSAIPSIMLLSVGTIGIGLTATYGALELYHNYQSKYADTPATRAQHVQDYHNVRRTRTIAGIGTVAVLSAATVLQFIRRGEQPQQ